MVGIFFLCYFFLLKKYLLVGTSDMLWTGGSGDHGSVDQREMYVCHTNQIGSTIKQQSNFLLLPIKLSSLAYGGVFAINTCHT